MWGKPANKRIYLDHAAATPLRSEVKKAMEPFWDEHFGNAGAVHQEGVSAAQAIEQARARLATVLHVRPAGVVFTSSGTESNNLAILGILESRRRKGIAYTDMEIISTKIEHPSIMETLKHAAELGVQISYVEVDHEGYILSRSWEKAISSSTVLVTFGYANSEIGVVQKVHKLARIVRAKEREFDTHIYVHIDAAQAPLWLSCELDRLGVDMISLDAGKCYGPKGVGVLALRHGIEIAPYSFGGSQEGGLRPGTENTPAIVGASEAIVLAQHEHEAQSKKVTHLRDTFITYVSAIEGVLVNGPREERIANNINISIPGLDTEFAVITLDACGIACSTKSACGGASGEGSHVVRHISNDELSARSTMRFSLGTSTTLEEVSETAKQLQIHVQKIRQFQSSL